LPISRAVPLIFVFARVHLAHVDGRCPRGNGDPPFLRVLHHLQRVRVLEQRLRWNAAPDEAGAAERFLLLDDGDLQTELRGADGGHVPAGSRPDHHDIVLICHATTPPTA
jgi:hypothetical protein